MKFIFGILLLSAVSAYGHSYSQKVCAPVIAHSRELGNENDLMLWMQNQKNVSLNRMLANISPDGSARGAVVASPSRKDPDYFKHWIRDAGLTMNLVVSLYEGAHSSEERGRYFDMLVDFTNFSRQNQTTPNPSGGLGEPVFYANGSPFNKDWGRPQNDGPGIRAYVLTRWAHKLLDEGKGDFVRSRLYDRKIPTDSVIKADLEYVSHHWTEPSFDLWEEVKGQHFYTLMVQRKAMIDGARLADRLDDGGAAQWYRQQASEMENAIRSHWNWQENVLQCTLHRVGGLDYKFSGLDASVMLGILHGDTYDGFFPVYDERALSTVLHLTQAFKSLYAINQSGNGVAIGRYPEDTYDGYDTGKQGNPWVLLTNAFAEFHYRVAKGVRAINEIRITGVNAAFYRDLAPEAGEWIVPGRVYREGEAPFELLANRLVARGDEFLKRVRYHSPGDGQLSEQMNRHNGYMQGARDLTWSHASMIITAWEREGIR